MTQYTAPSYSGCSHIQVGGCKFEVLQCSMCDQEYRQWVRDQPWYSRLDEWHHQRHHDSRFWYWIWRPYCNLVDRKYRKGT